MKCFFIALSMAMVLFKIVGLHTVGLGHRAIFAITPFDGKCQNLQRPPTHYCASLPFQRYTNFTIFLPKEGQSHGVQFSPLHHLIANVRIYTHLPHIFCASSYRFRDITILKFWPPNSRSRSRSAIVAITSFYCNCQNL